MNAEPRNAMAKQRIEQGCEQCCGDGDQSGMQPETPVGI